METRLEKFNFLMDILDKWKVNTAERVKNAGSFIFLTENSYVHHIVVSPNYRTTMPGLKTFFAMDVLEIYCSNSKSKASYTDIQAYLSDEKAKKYGFAFNLFDGCFDRELNRNAFLKDSFIMSRKKNLHEHVEKCEKWMPYVMLDKIRDTAWKKISKFYTLCEKECCEKCERKEMLYFQFAQAVALFEIFFDECVMLPLEEYIRAGEEKMQEIQREVATLQEKGKQISGDYTKIDEFLKDLKQLQDKKIVELEEVMQPVLAFKLLEAEFAVHLCALLNLLMVFETVNVCDADVQTKQIGFKLRDELYELVEKNFTVFWKRNRNRKKHFVRVNEHLEEVLTQYGGRNYNVTKLTVEFLEELGKAKKYRDVNKLQELCCMLAYPVYRELWGN